MRSTGDEVHVSARTVERGTDIGADGSGTEYCDFHTRELRSVEGTEELPNSVDEILSTVWKMGQQGFAQDRGHHGQWQQRGKPAGPTVRRALDTVHRMRSTRRLFNSPKTS
jgi:hypothetical protein